MLRSEIALAVVRAKELLEKEQDRVWDLLSGRREEVLTLDEIIGALHPDCKKGGSSRLHSYIELTVSAIFHHINKGVVEKVAIPGSNETYYGIKR